MPTTDGTADVGRWLDGAKRLHGTEALLKATDYRKAIETISSSLVRELRERGAPTADSTPCAGVRAADPISDAVDQIQAAVSDLLKALGPLDLGSALDSVTGALPSIHSLVTGLLGGGTPSPPTAG